MMVRASRQIETDATREFSELASLFAPGLFVKIVAYTDDSGTYDPHQSNMILGGLIAPVEDWKVFCRSWELILKKYDAPYFHFREWSDASQVVRGKRRPSSDFKKKNPYRKNWDQDKLDKFLFELAPLTHVTGNVIKIGSSVHPNKFLRGKLEGDLRADADIRQYHAHHLFISVIGATNILRKPWKNVPIAFFFDQTTDKDWKHTISDVYDSYKSRFPTTFRGLSFVDKKDFENMPLQAADMIAYRTKQIMEQYDKGENYLNSWPKLDDILMKGNPADVHNAKAYERYINSELDHVLPRNTK